MKTPGTHLRMLVAVLTVIATGCVNLPEPHPHPISTFDEALHTCRSLQSVRVTRKFHLAPTDSRISACLGRHGWNSDATKLPRS